MAEPQPSAIHEGAETPPAPAAGGAAAASEAAALSSLDNKTISGSDSAPKKEVDLKALNDAMKALGSGDGDSKKAATAGTLNKKEPAKLIKVEPADVSLLVSLPSTFFSVSLTFVFDDLFGIGCGEFLILAVSWANDSDFQAEHLDMSRTKATELLRAHDADAVKAMKAWVSASA
jgi:hypothetical protein